MAEANTIIVKFLKKPDGKDAAAPSRRIRQLVGSHLVRDARPLFPGEQEEDLASLYEVILDKSASLERALASLNKAHEVEYAHTPQEREPR